MEPPHDSSRREWIAVAAITAIGLVIRGWGLGGLGLTHFDEGIYALVGSWSLDPKGLASLDPIVISYAPPGFPILVGCSYAIFGRSDTAAILVSILAGSATIPVVAWLGRRTFGPGAGYASAVFAALSGPHIAFSRMALTDVSFVLAWLVAMGMGQRFLERPNGWRAIAMGLAVGVAQQLKYNGWLMGGIVALTATVGFLREFVPRRTSLIARFPTLRTFGWGLLGALVAWMVVWPWYRFVEGHGGYSALLRHQRSYLGEFRDWVPHLLTQVSQEERLGLDSALGTTIIFLICPTLLIGCSPRWSGRPPHVKLGGMVPAVCLVSFIRRAFGYFGLLILPWLLASRKVAERFVGVASLVMMVMVPFYHPYARLMLPIEAMKWLLAGWVVTRLAEWFYPFVVENPSEPRPFVDRHPWIVALIVGSFAASMLILGLSGRPPSALDPTASLRLASSRVASILPDEVRGLRLLVRPPVTFYLAGRVAVFPQSGADQLELAGDPRVWALVDSAILRSELGDMKIKAAADLPAKILDRWEVVEEIPTTMSLPTALDLDPTSTSREAPLWLLRPRRPGLPR